MANGKSTWRYNKLLTGRRNYFALGDSNLFNPNDYFLGTPGDNNVYTDTGSVPSNSSDNWMSKFNKGFSNIMGSDIMKNLNRSMGTDRNGRVLDGLRQIGMGTSNPFGMAADMLGQTISIIEEASKKERPSLSDVIGLAYGGDLNKFAIGGNVLNAASTGAALVGNYFEQASTPSVKSYYSDIQNKQLKNTPTVDSYDAIAQDAANLPNLGHVNYKDILGGNWFNAGNAISSTAQGASAGAMFGPIGAVAGGVAGLGSSIFGGLTAKNRAKRRARGLNNLIDQTNAFNTRSILNRAESVEDDMFNTMERDWYALGGNLSTHGADFTNGLIAINNGGIHETNPYEGVPFGVDSEGVPNLVEEGEVIYNDYVFSNRIMLPKTIRSKYKLRGNKSISFAGAAKQLSKEAEERPNDPISKKGLDAIMNDLILTQEGIKQNQAASKFAFGGPINKFATGTSNIQRNKGYESATMADAWSSTLGEALKNKLKAISILEGDAREKAIKELIDDTKLIQDSYYNEVYDRNTWGSSEYKKGSKAHQELFNKKGLNALANFAKVFNYRKGSKDTENTWVDDRIGDQTLLRMLGDSRNIKTEDLEEIRALSKDLGLNWDPLDDKNRLLYFSRIPNQPTETNSVINNNPASTTEAIQENVTKPQDTSFSTEKLPTGMKLASIVGPGVDVFTDSLGITNVPDYSSSDRVLNASREGYQRVGWNPIGNYLKYNPYDIDNTSNKLNAEAGATRRALLQNAGMNRGAAAAQLLAADNNYLNQLGELGIKAMQYNQGLRQQVEDFNRTTNVTNSQGLFQADSANLQAYEQAAARRLQGVTSAMQLRDAERARIEADKAANKSTFLDNLSSLGKENQLFNFRNALVSSGFAGNFASEVAKLLDLNKVNSEPTKAKGGKIKRRKGLTY